MRRFVGFLAAAMVAMGTVSAGNGEMFISIYGGYSSNDSGVENASGVEVENSIPYGIIWGGETPVAGGQIALNLNRVDDVKMDTLLFSIILNFASHDTRKSIGKVIYNRASGYVTIGVGLMRFEDSLDADIVLATELGVGTQFKFSRAIGFRVEVTGIWAPNKSIINVQATAGLGFYW